ncbi:50S ribosomal protein L4 [Planctomycetes bacterium Pan216]|uniref:Large ribosomal subunit protein uL4 n=1 Tax=Kolteria novifilia TaxID=2527975 RepID=A0A518AZM5_9BACT|nr:50S ribosomal protein L4 [Planctomycetes bacterium Pan216]
MLTLPVMNAEGKQVSTVEVDPAHFGGTVNKQLLHDAVVMYQANRRVGTHSTKRRGEMAGSGHKLYRQKGTGHARMGPKRSPVRRGGGKAHGPKPRDYSYSMPKKARRLATRMAILSKMVDDEMVVVDSLPFAEPKTKAMAGVLAALGLSEQSCLISLKETDTNVLLSARNIPGVDILTAGDLNALSVLKPKRMLVTRETLEFLQEAGSVGKDAESPVGEEVPSAEAGEASDAKTESASDGGADGEEANDG